MKIKFGDMTTSQMKDICDKYKRCNDGCPLFIDMGSGRKCASTTPWAYNTETEINLPDEEDKDGGICPYPNCHYKNDHDRCLGCDSRYKDTDEFDAVINDLKNGVQPRIGTSSKLPEGLREVH